MGHDRDIDAEGLAKSVGPEEIGSGQSGGVSIGDVEDGIHDTTIAGRDVLETTIDQLVYNVFEEQAGFGEQRDRQDVLELMKRVWISNVLEPWLASMARGSPTLELWPDAVAQPWEMVIDYSDQAREVQPAGTTIVDLYRQSGGSLLILGEADAGKTAALLELARQAIAWARKDPNEPIPIVVDLSWWTDRKLRLADWLVRMLTERYYVRRDPACTWLENDELCLFLDGLDKVELHRRREACVQAINHFCQEHGLVQIAVCCRTASYEALKTRFLLRSAVCVLPG
jgi:predicted NACHT family NTPase